MSFANTIHKIVDPFGGFVGKLDVAYDLLKPQTPAAPPPTPNINDAATAAQQTTDSLRARRGVLSNIYAGFGNQQPVSGSQQLGGGAGALGS